MIPPKQVQRAVEAFVGDVARAMGDVVSRLPALDGRRIEHDVATEAFNLVTAFIDVDRSHTDDELWGVIFAFGKWMPDQLGRAKPDDLRRTSLLVGRAAWLDQISPMFEILVTADGRFGTAHSRAYYDRAIHLAFTVIALDAQPSRAELQAIDDLRSHLLAAMSGLPASPLTPGGPHATA
ncbi:MAG: putative sporulation protein, partial [Acidimicrobiales bacterium]|nr:putative sporulation protein [Acidimicrobiales bacterium]